MRVYKIKNRIHKLNSRPHFWIKPVYSDKLVQGIHFPDGILLTKPGTVVKQCRIGGRGV